MNIHEKAEQERKYNEEVNRLLSSGCWLYDDGNGGASGCKGVKAANGTCDCTACPAYNGFYKVANGYASESGITWAEAVWLAKQFYDIPSKYMCNGEDGEYMKVHEPNKYNDCLRRQDELMGNEKPEELMIEPNQRTESKGQMTIANWFQENNEIMYGKAERG